jgi:hypothetical protein
LPGRPGAGEHQEQGTPGGDRGLRRALTFLNFQAKTRQRPLDASGTGIDDRERGFLWRPAAEPTKAGVTYDKHQEAGQ